MDIRSMEQLVMHLATIWFLTQLLKLFALPVCSRPVLSPVCPADWIQCEAHYSQEL